METETFSIQDYLVSMHMTIENSPKFSVLIQNFTSFMMSDIKNLHRDWGEKFHQIFFKFFDDFMLGDISELKDAMQGKNFKIFKKK